MKSIRAILLMPLLIFAVSPDFLAVKDGDFRLDRGEGDIVNLYGVNLGGLFVHEPWMSPLQGTDCDRKAYDILDRRFGTNSHRDIYKVFQESWITEADFELMRAEGLNCVRLPIFYRILMDSTGEWIRNSEGAIDFSPIDRVVDLAAEYGLWTILDLHGAPGSQNGADHSGDTDGARLYSETKWQDMTVEFWTEVASYYRNDPRIAGYDMLNEPSSNFPSAMGQDVVEVYKKIYSAIRSVDNDHPIIAEAIWNWNNMPSPSSLGWRNVAYELHCYPWDYINDLNGMKGFIDWHISEANTYRANYGVPLLVGEFTFFGQNEGWNYGMQQWTNAGFNWTSWSWKVTGKNSSWGMYTADDAWPNTPNVTTDSYEMIVDKWSKWNTPDYFTRNDMVCNAIQNVTAHAYHPEFTDTVFAIESSVNPLVDSSEWSHALELSLDRTVLGSRPTDSLDCSGVVKLLYGEESLFVLFLIRDSDSSVNGENPWDKDGVEIYIDRGNDKGDSFDSSDFQFRIIRGDSTISEDTHGTTGAVIQQIEHDSGYEIYCAIPWAQIGGAPSDSEKIGVDFHLNDNDGSGRIRKLAWNAMVDDAYLHPSSFGTALLRPKDKSTETTIHSRQNERVLGYNFSISGKNLRFETSQALSITIFDARGRVVLNDHVSELKSDVALNQLSSGIYLLQMESGAGLKSDLFYVQ